MVLAFVVAGCSPAPDPSPVGFDALAITVDEGHEVTDGEVVAFGFAPYAYGQYGGFFLEVGASLVGADEVWLAVRIEDAAGDVWVDLPQPANLAVWPGGWASTRVFLAPDASTPEREAIACALDGGDLEVSVEIGPLDDDTVSEALVVDVVASFDPAGLDCPG